MKHSAILIGLCLLAGALHAQREQDLSDAERTRQRSVPVPRAYGTDTLLRAVFEKRDWKPDAIQQAQQVGWGAPSDQIPLDSFYEAAKQWCCERMGADRFYKQVRVDWRTLKDERSKSIYYIRFYYFPEGMSDAMVCLNFRYYYFLDRREIYPPENLRDIRTDSTAYTFPFSRERAIQVARDSVVGQDPAIVIRVPEFTDDFHWQFHIDTKAKGIKSFWVDARTGYVGELKTSWRID